jgi:ABC-type Fe3+-siderophore transport system permease subunit
LIGFDKIPLVSRYPRFRPNEGTSLTATDLETIILLVGSETLACNIPGETELPAGVVTAGIGAPFFLLPLKEVR